VKSHDIAGGRRHLMRRRELMVMLLGAAGAGPAAALAQASSVPVIGVLRGVPRVDASPNWRGFVGGLGASGFVEGQNVAFDYRWPEGHMESLPALAASLVERRVAVILADPAAMALAAKHATSTIPIVFLVADDPVRDGVVASFNGPNGNLTGVAILQGETTLKQVELLNELIPGKAPLGILVDPNSETASIEAMTTSLAARFDRPVFLVHAANEGGFEAAFDALDKRHAAGVVISGGPLYSLRGTQLAALAARHALPAVFADADVATAGGLMSYGASVPDMFGVVGTLVGKILKGAKPADLPVQQPTKIMLKVNLKTAKSLGLTVPTSILVRADEVIE
jgi:putative tryptophan/tyrosine transport system substrate-binding protein